MQDVKLDYELDGPPDAAAVDRYRSEAAETQASVVAAFSTPNAERCYLVVSARGTCVLLDDRVSRATFDRDASPEEVAASLRR